MQESEVKRLGRNMRRKSKRGEERIILRVTFLSLFIYFLGAEFGIDDASQNRASGLFHMFYPAFTVLPSLFCSTALWCKKTLIEMSHNKKSLERKEM